VVAKAAAPALFALVFQLAVRANAVAPAILALALHPTMLTNASTFAFLALILNSAMLANAAAPAVLALISQPAMGAHTSSATLPAAVPNQSVTYILRGSAAAGGSAALGFAVSARRLLRLYETNSSCCQRARRWCSFEQSKEQ